MGVPLVGTPCDDYEFCTKDDQSVDDDGFSFVECMGTFNEGKECGDQDMFTINDRCSTYVNSM